MCPGFRALYPSSDRRTSSCFPSSLKRTLAHHTQKLPPHATRFPLPTVKTSERVVRISPHKLRGERCEDRPVNSASNDPPRCNLR
jgi:hypothetical protein